MKSEINEIIMPQRSISPQQQQQKQEQQNSTPRNQQLPLTTLTMFSNIFVHFLLFTFVIYICCLSFIDIQEGKMLFSWHPPLLTFASVLMSESLMCFSNSNLLTRHWNYQEKLQLHWILQMICHMFSTIGFCLVVWHKIRLDKSHFHTNHALYGLIGFIGMCLAMGGGVMAKYSIEFKHLTRPIYLKISHSVFGLIVYVCYASTVILGFYSSWYGKHGTNIGFYICFLSVIFVGQYVLYQPVITLTKRIKGVWLRAYQL